MAGGRWLLTGGGGYELLEVVPRTWTHLLAEAAGSPIDPRARIPASRRVRLPPHQQAGTGGDDRGQRARIRAVQGNDQANPVNRAIMATQSAVFPEHGMMSGPSPLEVP